MKKVIFLTLVALLAGIMILAGCSSTTSTSSTTTSQTTTTTQQGTTSTATQPTTQTSQTSMTTSTTAAGQPAYGGVLKAIAGGIPKNLGYPPEKAPNDNYQMLPVIERLCDWDAQGNEVPWLAKSWDISTDPPSLTWHFQEGVKFTDGSDFDAEAVKWNYQLAIDNNRLSDASLLTSMDVVDKYTLKLNLTKFSWNMLENWGLLMQVISPTAFEKAGGGDLEKSKEWARANAVGTGPFIVSDFQRDVVIKFTKNPNYWKAGYPYLDAIELRYIPDPMTATAMMKAGQTDMWFDVTSVENMLDLQNSGFKINWGPGMFNCIVFDSINPDSPTHNKLVREAIEYALDRPGIAGMLGSGLYEPLHEMASSTWPGYVEGYDPRPYNPDKAKELLKEAGYPNGFKTKMLVSDSPAARDATAAIQAYLGDVGIQVEPDVADLGRYLGSLFVSGYSGTDLVLTASGINPSTTDLFIHFGPRPVTFRTGNMLKSQEFLDLCEAALDPSIKSAGEAVPAIQAAVKQAGEDAMLIPLWRTPNSAIMQPYVHSDYFLIHGIIWTPYDDWMEPH
jgi:peptide/nickel transport system substrate-binding protein